MSKMRVAHVNEEMVGQMRVAVTTLVADLNESLRRQDLLAENCRVLEESTGHEALKAAREETAAMREQVDQLLQEQNSLLERHGQQMQTQEENYRMQMEAMERAFLNQADDLSERKKQEIAHLEAVWAGRVEEVSSELEATRDDLSAVREADARSIEENTILRENVQELHDRIHNLEAEKGVLETTLDRERNQHNLLKGEVARRHEEMVEMLKEQEEQIVQLKREKDEIDPLIAGFRKDLQRLETSRERAREDATRAIQEAQAHMTHAHQQQEQSVKLVEAVKVLKKETAAAQDALRESQTQATELAREAHIERLALLKGLEEASNENAGLRKILKDNGISVSVRYGDAPDGSPSFHAKYLSAPLHVVQTPGMYSTPDKSRIASDISMMVVQTENALKASVQAEIASVREEAAGKNAPRQTAPPLLPAVAAGLPPPEAAPPPPSVVQSSIPAIAIPVPSPAPPVPAAQPVAASSGGTPPQVVVQKAVTAGPASHGAGGGFLAEGEEWVGPREIIRPYQVEAVVTVFVQGAKLQKFEDSSASYVTSSIGHSIFNTAVKRGSTPEWRESFRFALAGNLKNDKLEVKVCDGQSKPPGQMVGCVKVPLERLARTKTEDAWFDLVDSSGTIRHEGGQVMLRMTYTEMTMATKVSFGYLESLGVSDKTKWEGGFYLIDPLTQELRGFADKRAITAGVWPFGQKLSVLIRSCELAGEALPSAIVLSNPSQRIVLRAPNEEAAKAWLDAAQKALGIQLAAPGAAPKVEVRGELKPAAAPLVPVPAAADSRYTPEAATVAAPARKSILRKEADAKADSNKLCLYASIFRGRDIPQTGGDLPNVQCRIECGPEAVFTKVDRRTCEPRFDETVMLNIHPEAQSVLIQVLDVSQEIEHGGRIIGYARRSLDDIIASGEEGGWLELLNSRNEVVQGTKGPSSLSVHFEVAKAGRNPQDPLPPSPPSPFTTQTAIAVRGSKRLSDSPSKTLGSVTPTASALPKAVSPQNSGSSLTSPRVIGNLQRGLKSLPKDFVWAEATQREVINSESPDLTGNNAVWSLAALGDKIFAGCQDGLVRAYSALSGEVLYEMQGHADLVLALCLNGSRLFSGSGDTTIREWDIDSMMCVGVHMGHSQRVGSLLVVGGRTLASGSADDSIRLWDLERRDPNTSRMESFKTLTEHSDSVLALAVADGMLLSGSIDQSVCVWDPKQDFGLIRKLMGHSGHVLSIIGIPGFAVSSSDDGSLCVWDAKTWSMTECVRDEAQEAVSHMTYTAGVLICSRDTSLQMYDPRTWSRLRSLPILASGKTGTYLSAVVDDDDAAEVSRQQGGVVCSLASAEGALLTGNYAGVISRWQ